MAPAPTPGTIEQHGADRPTRDRCPAVDHFRHVVACAAPSRNAARQATTWWLGPTGTYDSVSNHGISLDDGETETDEVRGDA